MWVDADPFEVSQNAAAAAPTTSPFFCWSGMPPAKIMIRPPLEAWIPKKLLAWPPRVGGKILRRDVERPARKCLVDRDVDAADPRAVHSDVSHQVAADVDDRDVGGLPVLLRLGLPGGDHTLGIVEGNRLKLRGHDAPAGVLANCSTIVAQKRGQVVG